MKKFIPLIISGVIAVGAVGCEPPSRTSADAPSGTNENVNAPTQETAQKTQEDATGEVRKDQIESDIRAREQRNNTTGGDADGMSPHPNPSKAVQEWQSGGAKIIDFIFGVSHTQHWHSLNLGQYPEHYSGLKYLPYSSAAISKVQDSMGAGVYFNPYITVNGTMIKYGVVNLDTLASDLSEWNTLYLAGRLQKPVKILRDDPRVRLANQVNLISALRTALLMLPEKFTERQLYERIAGLSYKIGRAHV